MELRLPRWTVAEEWDLGNWLFRWGNGVRIEQPLALCEVHLQQAKGVVELYAQARRLAVLLDEHLPDPPGPKHQQRQ